MADDNLRHWSALSKTDPKHTKPFQRAGGFRGTATRPIWVEMRLTEHFGPCGIGWGCDEPAFSIVPAGEEILVFCTLACWYMDDGKRATVYGIGGDKILVKQQSGLRADDEAYKKAFTDALGNAFKHVGSGADVHMGLFEDSKYRAEVAAEFAEEPAAKPASDRYAPRPPHAAQPASPAPAATGRAPSRAAQEQAMREGAATLPVNPEEPPEIMEASRAARAQFWNRDHYGIDPAVIQGGMARWDAEFLAQAEAAQNLDQFLKLKQDCAEAGYTTAWAAAVQPAVKEHFVRKRTAIETRLSGGIGAAA